jgi:lysophospholipase L1-like esterase
MRFGKLAVAAAIAAVSLAGAAQAAPHVAPADAQPAAAARPLPFTVGGRTLREVSGDATGWRHQWPGVYFEAGFKGSAVLFRVGPGDVILHVLVDDAPADTLVKPKAGTYRVDGFQPGRHVVRIETASESQAGPDVFGGFFLPAGGEPEPAPARARQIEFIGDSHTVGYGVTSSSRDCTQDQVWATTDTSQAYGPLTARRYGADYQVNAISGRGIVRNYNGFAADPLPVAYPFVLFDKAQRFQDPSWRPQIIVLALGTNDFSTPLNPGEKWKSRDELHVDYDATYVAFLKGLRAQNPEAYFVLWSTDMFDGEIRDEARKVVGLIKAAGDDRIDFIPLGGFELSGCHWHPSVADDRKVSDALIAFIDARPELWRGKR